MTPPEATVVAHLARLDAAARRRFVADLWAARGYETERDGAVVRARRRDESLTLFPVPPRRLGRPSLPDTPVDVVVGFDGTVPAAVGDARCVGPADLHGMLRHALDPAAAADLCRRHFGAAGAALDPPPALRARRRLADLRRGAAAAGTGVVPLGLLTLAVVVALVGGVALAPGPGPPLPFAPADPVAAGDATAAGVGGDGPETGGTPSPRPTTTPTATPAATDPVPPGALDDVPGVGPDGVRNLTALAVAHERAVPDRYTLWLDVYRPLDGLPATPRTQRDTDIAVDGDRYLVEETVERGDDRRLVRVVYFDGADWYVDDRTTSTPRVRRIDGSEEGAAVAPDPRSLRGRLVREYLATPESAVTGQVESGGGTRYRIEGEGRPPAFDADRVFNYSVVAFVDEAGLVHDATAEFTVLTVEGSYRLRFEWTYGRFGTTTVTRPAWHERQRSTAEGENGAAIPRSNATATPTSTPTADANATATPTPTPTPG